MINSCSGFNFIQKSQCGYMSISNIAELGGFKDCQFQYIIIFQSWQSLKPPASLLWEINITLLYETESWTTFIWSIFWYNAYFCNVVSYSEPTLLFLNILIFRKRQSLEVLLVEFNLYYYWGQSVSFFNWALQRNTVFFTFFFRIYAAVT